VRRIRGIGGRWRVLVPLMLAVMAAGAVGLSPVFAGSELSGGLISSAFEAGAHPNHASTSRDLRADRIREARCANRAYRQIHYASCGKLTPARARYQRAQRARCARSAYRRSHPLLCPRVRDVKRLNAIGDPPQAIGRWNGRISTEGLPINAILLPTGKVLWFAYPEKDTWYHARTGLDPEDVNWAEAYVFDPATGQSVRRDPPINPETGRPFNIWCAGQTLLRDGRVVVAGGNFHYLGYSTNRYQGLDVVLTFNPFNETWTYQGRMADGRWYPTLTELADGRVAIVAGLNKAGTGDNADIDLFTPSPDMNGVGSIQTVGTQYFGIYPHMFLAPDGKLRTIGPRKDDSHMINTGNWSVQNTQQLPFRREWGAATLLPSGPAGPTRLLVQGGSDIDVSQQPDGSYGTAPATNSTILVDLATGAQTPGPPMRWGRSHLNTRILPDGTLLTIGGGAGAVDNSLYEGPVKTAELYNPATGTWTETDPQVDARTYHSTALVIPDGRVISMGDDRQIVSDNGPNGGQLRTVEYYEPPYLFKGARPSIGYSPGGTPYGVPVGIGTTDGGIAKAVLLKLGATTHATDADQRSLELPVAPVTGGLQFTTPSNPNAAPPGYYMLFLVNSAGVPSVAKMIRLDSGLPAPPAVPPQAGAGSAARYPAPRLKRLKAKVSYKGRFATLRLTMRVSKAFVGNVKLFPLPKGKSAKARRAAKKPMASKNIRGRGGRNVTVVVRFSIKGKRFPLKLRMTIGLRDPRGGPTRVTTKGLLLLKRPKPTARILAKAK
jgi:Domain of unknown function (DUF1929)